MRLVDAEVQTPEDLAAVTPGSVVLFSGGADSAFLLAAATFAPARAVRVSGLPAAPFAGPDRGFYWIPEVQDEVLVAFGQGSFQQPFLLGGLYNGQDLPDKPWGEHVGSTDGAIERLDRRNILRDREAERLRDQSREIERQLIHCRWTGESTWIPFGDFRPGLEFENHTSHPAPGQILIYVGDISECEILFPYGACSFSSRVGPLAGNHFATLTSTLDYQPQTAHHRYTGVPVALSMLMRWLRLPMQVWHYLRYRRGYLYSVLRRKWALGRWRDVIGING